MLLALLKCRVMTHKSCISFIFSLFTQRCAKTHLSLAFSGEGLAGGTGPAPAQAGPVIKDFPRGKSKTQGCKQKRQPARRGRTGRSSKRELPFVSRKLRNSIFSSRRPRSCPRPPCRAGGGARCSPRSSPSTRGRWPRGSWPPSCGSCWGWSPSGASASPGPP